MIGFNGIHPQILLKLVGAKFVDQADASAFLQLINEDSRTFFRDGALCKFQLFAAVTSAGVKNISGQALGMDANQRSVMFRRSSHDKSNSAIVSVVGFETEINLEYAIPRGQCRLADVV